MGECFPPLPQETKEAWFSAIETTLGEYQEWARGMREMIAGLPEEDLILPGIGGVREVI